jgi:uncharacterized protein
MSDTTHFFLKLIPPRPSFPFDMDDDERSLMAEHAAYLQGHFDAGKVVAYGPVLDAAGPYGMAVLAVADEAEARRLCEDDPTVSAGLNRYELSPMMLGAGRP